MLLDHAIRVGVEPRFVSKLGGRRPREGCQQRIEEGQVFLARGRELEENRAEALTKRSDAPAENAGQPDIYLSSADWMPRNFYRRVEIAFPIDAPDLRDEMVNDILPSLLNDQVKARELQPDGGYVRLRPAEGAARSQAQLHFRERSRQTRKAAAELQAKSGVKLIPIKAKRDQGKRA